MPPLFALLLCGGTAAYLTAYDAALNSAAAGRNETEIQEDFPEPTPGITDEDPEYQKTVWAANTSHSEDGFNVDCYVRLMVTYSNNDIGKAVVLKNLNTADWVYDSRDGYYYYIHVLSEGERTRPLFTGFTINGSMVDDTYKDKLGDFGIHIYEESVQSAQFENYRAAWDYYLNPVKKGQEAAKT